MKELIDLFKGYSLSGFKVQGSTVHGSKEYRIMKFFTSTFEIHYSLFDIFI